MDTVPDHPLAGMAHPLAHPEVTSFGECREAMLPVNDVLARVGSKWTMFIIIALGYGPMRFSELKRRLDGISQKVLTATLRDLERDGFVSRTVTPSIPPRVDYELTEMGYELCEPLAVLGRWADANRGRVAAARQRFAERQAEERELSW
jgi:DNA-binding HxlR family transcriptional regulator